MDFISSLLASEQVQTGILTIFGLLLTAAINRAAGAFSAATGVRIEQRHQQNLHSAIITGVESALRNGPDQALKDIRFQVVRHIRESVPDAISALTPSDSVLDRLIDRYASEAVARLRLGR